MTSPTSLMTALRASNVTPDHRRGPQSASAGIHVLGLIAAIAVSSWASAADLTCPPGDVPCLADAIRTANTNGQSNTLMLSADVYTFTMADDSTPGRPDGLPVLAGILAVHGVEDATILQREPMSGLANRFRFLHVGPTGNLTLEGVVIQGFRSGSDRGGALFNEGILRIVNSTITGNIVGQTPDIYVGGGIYNAGTLVIEHSSITNNVASGMIARGAGIYNAGTMRIEQSAITDNKSSTGAGGGIFNSGVAVIINTTVARNSCLSGFFGDQCENSGGISNCRTGIFNPCGAGGTVDGAPALIIGNSTIVNNSGGIANATGSVWVQNTILARNDFGIGQPDCSGVMTSQNHNLIGDLTGCAIALAPQDLLGDPLLGEFSDDGEPGSRHFPLLFGSPAIDAGNDEACPPADQLGQPRAGRCDIGAVEFQAPRPNSCLHQGTVRLRGRVLTTMSRWAVPDVTLAISGPDGCQDVAITSPVGRYVFPTLGGGTYTVTPFKEGCTFVPADRTVTTLEAAANAGFRAVCVDPDDTHRRSPGLSLPRHQK